MEACYSEGITINQSYWGEASTDLRYYVGDQTVWNEVNFGNGPSAWGRRQFFFNRIRPVVSVPSGYQRRNRKSIIAVPIENADQRTADQFTKIFMWIDQQENMLETISDAFEGALVTGMNLLQVWVDYRSDPVSGDIKIDNCSYNSFLMDPYFRKADLSDCNYIWKRTYLSKREIISLLPDSADEILELYGGDTRDGKFQFMPENYNYGPQNSLAYDEFYYRDYRKQKMLVDAQTGEVQEWKGQDEESLELFLNTYPQISLIEQEVPTVRLAIVVQGKVMYDGPNPLGIDKYPFVPVFSYYNPQIADFPYRIQGMVRGLRDAQFLYNRRKTIELDILESQVNSGWKYKENALVNPKDVFLSGQGRGLALKEEAQMTDVERILPPDIPAGMIQLSEILGREIRDISGVNEEMLGSALDDKAGVLSMLRQGAGLTTLMGLFDNLDRSQKILGKLLLDIIQSNFTPGKVKKILNGEQPSAQFYNKAFGKYDCAVEEGLNTTTQRQMNFAQMLQLREVGVPIPDDQLLESATIQNKQQIIDAIARANEASQAAQQQEAELAQQQALAQINLTQSTAKANEGLGLERISRIEENKALAEERRAEAVKDEEMALLNFVKALKEIEDIDLKQIEKLVSIAGMIKQVETEKLDVQLR
jgi:hypothetical protein